ncbi:glycosyltransferase family 4 protein [Geomesophilobacter sediminis]|uniref:Glycosyltransferase family 4 protein n=1 Tax=Geomesophilobacter sediminis TaxID=2798584 RepID=A0A8J7M1X8_9BACT|nr:glycosyltransferase family 1 protein [Geomesophilobacter sediminis]MBJ6727033.1 glycosyltransferase family 4 protein [Geomesophilobacter sediminis]
MNIGLNGISLYPGKIGGMETYFRNLLYWLQVIDRENSYGVILNEGYVDSFPLPNPSFTLKPFHYELNSWNWKVRGVLRNVLNVDPLRRKIADLGFDLVHHPFNVLNPVSLSVPSVLTVHDIQHEYCPEFFSAADLHKRKRLFGPSCKEALRIISISDFTRSCIMERYDVAPEKIDVVPVGCGAEYRPIEEPAVLEAVRKKYTLDRPFLFYPAATWPHKNHKALLAALRLLRERWGFDGCLVLTGIAKQSHDALLSEIAKLGLHGFVKVLGYLPLEDLPVLFNLAEMLAFPSLFEGFGIPVLEAMACGCPVVCSNVTSLPEVAGDAALLFDPKSPEAIAEAVWSVWNDRSERDRLRRLGFARVPEYRWDRVARKTVDVYRAALQGK